MNAIISAENAENSSVHPPKRRLAPVPLGSGRACEPARGGASPPRPSHRPDGGPRLPSPRGSRIEHADPGCPEIGMVQILGYSGNSTDRPHASTVGIRSVVGPIAGSGTLEAVPAQPVEPVRLRLASQELSGELGPSHSTSSVADSCLRNSSGVILRNSQKLNAGNFRPKRPYGVCFFRCPARNWCKFQYSRFKSSKPCVILRC